MSGLDSLEKFVLKCVRRDVGAHPTDALAVELERRGDAAYECLKELIRSTKLPVERIPAAMRCLRVASKHQSGARWVDLLAFSMPFVEHADRGLRSTAAHLVASHPLADKRASALGLTMPPRAARATAVRRALSLGVDDWVQPALVAFVSLEPGGVE